MQIKYYWSKMYTFQIKYSEDVYFNNYLKEIEEILYSSQGVLWNTKASNMQLIIHKVENGAAFY